MLFLIDPQPPCHGSFGHFYSSTYITEPRNIPISYVAHFVEIRRVRRVVNIAEPQGHFCKRNWANRGLTNNKTVGAQRIVTVLWQNHTVNSPRLGCDYIPHRPHASASSTAIFRFVWELLSFWKNVRIVRRITNRLLWSTSKPLCVISTTIYI